LELVRHQAESDKAVAEKLGMAPSNFAVVKRRLVEKGMLLEHIRVNMHKVRDCHVAALVWLEYNRPVRDQFRDELEGIRSNFPVAYTYGSSDWELNVDYFKSFEDAEDVRLKLAEYLQKKLSNYLSNYMWKIVPMSHLTTCTFKSRLVEYALTHQISKLDPLSGAGGACEFPEAAERLPALNTTEKRVLVALRRYPNFKKSEIAEKVGMQQSSLSEVFRQLRRKGIISHIRTIAPDKLPGRNIATFAWLELKRPLIGEKGQELVRNLVETTPQAFKLHYTKTFIFMNSFFNSLDKAENSHLKLLELFGDNIKTFNFKIVPCSHLNIAYAPYFLENLFDVRFVPQGTPLKR
jgi:DNA-binding Lrp family transcriptional regulator